MYGLHQKRKTESLFVQIIVPKYAGNYVGRKETYGYEVSFYLKLHEEHMILSY